MTAGHRLQQGLRALFAFTRIPDQQFAAQYLSSTQLQWFTQMTRGEQLHSLNVLRDVLAQGATPDDLAAAALLHDVGKSRYAMTVWQKTLPVVVRALIPRWYIRLSQGNPANWLARPFVVNAQHPAWGGELLATQTDASERLIWLVTHHADALSEWIGHPYAPLLQRLQVADNAN